MKSNRRHGLPEQLPDRHRSVLLRPTDLTPLRDDFIVIGAFNPGAVQIQNGVVMLVRVAEKPSELRPGFIALPRWEMDGTVVVDWVAEEELELADPRVVRRKGDQLHRLTSISHLRVFHKREGSTDWEPGANLLPYSPMEEFGIEDARITEIDRRYWITYVAVSRHGAATALASTSDFVTFTRHGIVLCPENKDMVLFPRKVDDHFVSLHRPNPSTHFNAPEIWLGRSPDRLHWGRHECLQCGGGEWESGRVGAGPPPILIEEGWLLLYHGSRRPLRAGDVGAYSAGALLLDRDNPALILRRSYKPIMQPTTDFERFGFVNNVVFPTGLIERGNMLDVYYGAADTCAAVIVFSRKELLAALD